MLESSPRGRAERVLLILVSSTSVHASQGESLRGKPPLTQTTVHAGGWGGFYSLST